VTCEKKRHNIMDPFVMNMRKHDKSMVLLSNLLIHDENIMSAKIDAICDVFAKHHEKNVIDRFLVV
jgi:hypothetical protein